MGGGYPPSQGYGEPPPPRRTTVMTATCVGWADSALPEVAEVARYFNESNRAHQSPWERVRQAGDIVTRAGRHYQDAVGFATRHGPRTWPSKPSTPIAQHPWPGNWLSPGWPWPSTQSPAGLPLRSSATTNSRPSSGPACSWPSWSSARSLSITTATGACGLGG